MYKVEKVGDVVVVRLEGRIDVQAALELEKQVNDIFNTNINKIVFDFEKVQHLSSSGIRVLISSLRRTTANKGGVKLSNVEQSIRKILKLVELDSLFMYYDSVDEAVKAFRE
ncbi:MAG: STAS domain-containing protein [Spirochaetia bacterium]|nr:STAS domain-containing protein [Spirochaetota bacterium]MCX8096220.1 STAS domain-containing protein [Spirochaetota bacterium]MDW8112936.1 STAS domain-containing protein [Spirochaetia bacterium]